MQKRILYHISFWVAYVLFKSYLNYSTSPDAEQGIGSFQLFVSSLIPQLVYLIVKIPLVYLLFGIINRYFQRQWSLQKSVLIALLIFAASTFNYVVVNHFVVLDWFYGYKESFKASFVLGSIIYSAFIISFACGMAITIKLIRMNLRQKEASQEVMKKKLETELNLLKSQINPHFLFNTLNNIYSLAMKKSDDTGPVVMKLSKLLRFMLYESEKDRILISKEVKLLEDYIELERIRYNDRLSLTISIDISNPNANITPLLLLPLIENAFKHGASESMKTVFIEVVISEQNNHLKASVKNSKERNATSDDHSGIGLKNVRRQLELTYNDFNLDVKNEEHLFEVDLEIDLGSYML
ncbi:MAG: sensor histidine kinase [Bacteroidota bacterium]